MTPDEAAHETRRDDAPAADDSPAGDSARSNAPPGAGVRVRVLFFGAARDVAGRPDIELEISAPATTKTAFAEVLARFPSLAERFNRSLLFAVNQEYATADRPVRDGDELAVFPPVSGGSIERDAAEVESASPDDASAAGDAKTADDDDAGAGRDFYELTTDPIDVGQVARRVVVPECGATVTLDGYAREYTRGRARTLHLVYEAYAPMALREMRRLIREARARFDIAHLGIVHRTGRLEIGETSVVISVSAPHRRAAFEACEWAIKELKRTVPVWKKEFYEGGEVWVEGEAVPEQS